MLTATEQEIKKKLVLKTSAVQAILEYTAKDKGIELKRIYPENAEWDSVIYENGITLSGFEIFENNTLELATKLIENKLGQTKVV